MVIDPGKAPSRNAGPRRICFFKQKTACEISTRDWSSDVCSSDLARSSASARRRTCRRCAGASPATSFGAGSSPSRARPSCPASRGGSDASCSNGSVLVLRRAAGERPHLEVDLHLAGFLELQHHRNLLAFLERALEVDQHEMRTVRLELEAALGGYVVPLDLAHAHDVAVLDADVGLDLGCRVGRASDEALRLSRLIAEGHVAGGCLLPRRRRSYPGVAHLHLPKCGKGNEKRNNKQNAAHFRFSSSWSLRHRILPVAVRGSSSTNSTMRGTLNAAIFPRAHSMISWARTAPFACGFSTMTAFTVSPR